MQRSRPTSIIANRMKYLLALLGLVIIDSSCIGERNNHNRSGLNPSSMSEEELYLAYGLEVPDDFYYVLQSKIGKTEIGHERYCGQIQNENTVSQLVNVLIEVDSNKIITAVVRLSDYSNKVNKLIENTVIDTEWTYETEPNNSGHFDFRLNLEKLCEIER